MHEKCFSLKTYNGYECRESFLNLFPMVICFGCAYKDISVCCTLFDIIRSVYENCSCVYYHNNHKMLSVKRLKWYAYTMSDFIPSKRCPSDVSTGLAKPKDVSSNPILCQCLSKFRYVLITK